MPVFLRGRNGIRVGSSFTVMFGRISFLSSYHAEVCRLICAISQNDAGMHRIGLMDYFIT